MDDTSKKKANEPYPTDRPKYWAMKYIRAMGKACAANEIGPLGAYLCSMIATTEDASGYRRAVTYWDQQLLPILGATNEKALALARTKCVDNGWLHYEHGRRGVPGRYWTTLPLHAMGVDDHPTDEGNESGSYSEPNGNQTGSQKEPNGNQTGSQKEPNGVQTGSYSEPNGFSKGTKRGLFFPIPIPTPEPIPEPIPKPKPKEPPNPQGGSDSKKTTPILIIKAQEQTELPDELDTPEFRQVWAEWIQHRIELKKPMKPTSAKTLLTKLAKAGERKAIESITHSIANGWQGVFEPSAGSVGSQRDMFAGIKSFMENTDEQGRFFSRDADIVECDWTRDPRITNEDVV